MGARSRRLLAVLLCVVFTAVASAVPSGANGGGGKLDDGGVTGTWKKDPESGYWTSVPVGIVDDPYGYRFELACADRQGNVSVACLATQPDCDATDDGRLVYWFAGLKGTPKPTWNDPYPAVEETNGVHSPQCVYATNPDDVLERIAGVILEEFQNRPVSPGVLTLQPSPHTLIRANTNFFVESKEQVFDFELLGQDVKIQATPTEYTWNYGDGSTYGPTRDSGYALRDDELGEETHTSYQYQETGDYQVSVTVHFTGEYSVNGGPMIPIDGRGEFATPSQMISVWKSESRLVSGTCLENPDGWAC